MNNKTKKLCIASILCTVAIIGSMFSIPVFGSKCSPIQHMVNILCAVALGPWYGIGVAFTASLIRNILGIGSIMAFPGSMFGELFCGIAYWKYKSITVTLIAEVLATSILGGLSAYPIATLIMGVDAGSIAYYGYILPFFISTLGGAILSAFIVINLEKAGGLSIFKEYREVK